MERQLAAGFVFSTAVREGAPRELCASEGEMEETRGAEQRHLVAKAGVLG